MPPHLNQEMSRQERRTINPIRDNEQVNNAYIYIDTIRLAIYLGKSWHWWVEGHDVKCFFMFYQRLIPELEDTPCYITLPPKVMVQLTIGVSPIVGTFQKLSSQPFSTSMIMGNT